MNLNSHIIKLTGSAEASEPLLLGHDYRLLSTASCYRIEDVNNEDGTYDTVYKLKLITTSLQDDLGKVIETKQRGKMSYAMKMAIIMLAREKLPDMDEEDAYKLVMNKLIEHLPDIVDEVLK